MKNYKTTGFNKLVFLFILLISNLFSPKVSAGGFSGLLEPGELGDVTEASSFFTLDTLSKKYNEIMDRLKSGITSPENATIEVNDLTKKIDNTVSNLQNTAASSGIGGAAKEKIATFIEDLEKFGSNIKNAFTKSVSDIYSKIAGAGETSSTGAGETSSTGAGETSTGGAGETSTAGAGETSSTGAGETSSTGAGETSSTGAGETSSTGAGETSTGEKSGYIGRFTKGVGDVYGSLKGGLSSTVQYGSKGAGSVYESIKGGLGGAYQYGAESSPGKLLSGTGSYIWETGKSGLGTVVEVPSAVVSAMRQQWEESQWIGKGIIIVAGAAVVAGASYFIYKGRLYWLDSIAEQKTKDAKAYVEALRNSTLVSSMVGVVEKDGGPSVANLKKLAKNFSNSKLYQYTFGIFKRLNPIQDWQEKHEGYVLKGRHKAGYKVDADAMTALEEIFAALGVTTELINFALPTEEEQSKQFYKEQQLAELSGIQKQATEFFYTVLNSGLVKAEELTVEDKNNLLAQATHFSYSSRATRGRVTKYNPVLKWLKTAITNLVDSKKKAGLAELDALVNIFTGLGVHITIEEESPSVFKITSVGDGLKKPVPQASVKQPAQLAEKFIEAVANSGLMKEKELTVIDKENLQKLAKGFTGFAKRWTIGRLITNPVQRWLNKQIANLENPAIGQRVGYFELDDLYKILVANGLVGSGEVRDAITRALNPSKELNPSISTEETKEGKELVEAGAATTHSRAAKTVR